MMDKMLPIYAALRTLSPIFWVSTETRAKLHGSRSQEHTTLAQIKLPCLLRKVVIFDKRPVTFTDISWKAIHQKNPQKNPPS